MRNVIRFGAVLAPVFVIWACSSSSNGGGGSSGSTSGSSSGSSTSGTSSGTASDTGDAGDGAAFCTQAEINMFAKTEGVDASAAGDGGAFGACVKAMCSQELTDCMTEDCQTCGSAIGNCAVQNCLLTDLDASIPKSTKDAAGTCDAPGPECAALATCCTQIQSFSSIVSALAPLATDCTTNSVSCDEATCMATISEVNSVGMGLLTCKGP
jgi:hypothetical protein